MYDLVIIGAGSAGLTSAIYASRAGLNFTVLEQDGFGGGQITSAFEVENYPGFHDISGADLAERFKEQAVKLGAKIELSIVESIEKCDDKFIVHTHFGDIIKSKSVIVATGAVPRKLNIQGEKEFTGRGISYCALCDGAFFADRDVIVAGGGDTAVEDAMYLASICKSLTLMLRGTAFRAAKSRVDKLLALPNVSVLYGTNIIKINGDKIVNSVLIKDKNGERSFDTNAVFIAVGTAPATDCLLNLPIEVENGYVVANEDCKTNVGGLFVAGDIRKKPLRQVVTAVADGANALYSAIEYLKDF
ncbi:MAG: FAD-dependent oxidoreductase [Clostridiales bacterium]|nr:FAD-dependent oxidoreductase [Clostridiales bacterium]